MAVTTSTNRSTAGRKVLAVGADTMNTRTLAGLLQRFGYTVQVAEDAAKAVGLAAKFRPALIVADLVLQDKKGSAVIDAFRSNRATAAVPLICMVPPTDASSEGMCRSYGAGCIMKPVQSEELYRIVQASIEPRPRATMRVEADLPVSVNNHPVRSSGPCHIDLSEEGMYVSAYNDARPQARLRVKIQLHDRMISAEGAVVYSHPAERGRYGEPGTGMKFVSIAPQDRDAIRQFVQEEVRRGIA